MPTSNALAPAVSLHPVLAATLPSASSAWSLVNGEPGALPLVLVHTALRAGIISVGLLVAGQKQIAKNAIVSSLAIEAFVLGWAAIQKGKQA